uniref:Uncharacterized protein n=1 Tax=Physcomitrium patens TaxID=3218 RepID=A0A2K1J0Y0_PHYPA|nr:hypothetical protein PHYPA_023083 [Physcomitrium patens]
MQRSGNGLILTKELPHTLRSFRALTLPTTQYNSKSFVITMAFILSDGRLSSKLRILRKSPFALSVFQFKRENT